MKNLPRLVMALVSTLIWEIILVAAWLWGLPLLGVNLPIPYLLIATASLAVYAIVSYHISSQVYNKEAMAGMSDMARTRGKAICRLNPAGTVRIHSELWDAKTLDQTIEAGEEIEVVKQEGMKLIVRRRSADSPGATR